MAVGQSSLDKLYDLNRQIFGSIGFGRDGVTDSCIYSTWNTFQYVAKNLSIWADDTTIGAEVKQQVIKLSETLYQLMIETKKLNSKIDNFFIEQTMLNGGFEAGDLRAFK